jgi:glycine/D-amino acid oxidase-like deaminating enzyme
MSASNTVVLGTGIIGVSTAYYLSQSQPPSSIHLVESSPNLFASASGYAAGFLAADWFSPPVSALGKLSFDEHKRLAEEFGGREKWGYMKSQALSYSAGRSSGKKSRGDDWLREGTSRAEAASEGLSEFVGEEDVPRWLRRAEGDSVEVNSEEGTTAQMWAQGVASPVLPLLEDELILAILETHYDFANSFSKAA